MSESTPKSDGKVTVFMVGNSRGNTDGQRRQVDQATADQLVAEGLARFPASKQE